MEPEDEREGVKVVPPSALHAITLADRENQAAVAVQHPRDMEKVLERAIAEIEDDPEVAGDCRYRLVRGKGEARKEITGLSVRAAEILAWAFGNVVAGYQPIEEADDYVVAQGVFRDLENNNTISVSIRRGIKGRYGRYTADMIGVTMNAAGAIAFRNAVLKGIPHRIKREFERRAIEIAKGDPAHLDETRAKLLRFFHDKHRIGEAEVCTLAGVESVDKIGTNQLVILRGIATALKDGDTTVEAMLARNGGRSGPEAGVGDQELAEKVAAVQDDPEAPQGTPGTIDEKGRAFVDSLGLPEDFGKGCR